MNEAGHPHLPQDRRRLPGLFRRVVGHPHVQGLARPDGGGQGAHGFLQRGFRIRPVGIENIHILQPQAFQALVEGGQHVFPASPVPIGAGPHAVARFGGDNQLVPIRGQIGFQHPSQGFLRRAGNRAVVVGRVDMGHAQIEGPQ